MKEHSQGKIFFTKYIPLGLCYLQHSLSRAGTICHSVAFLKSVSHHISTAVVKFFHTGFLDAQSPIQ